MGLSFSARQRILSEERMVKTMANILSKTLQQSIDETSKKIKYSEEELIYEYADAICYFFRSKPGTDEKTLRRLKKEALSFLLSYETYKSAGVEPAAAVLLNLRKQNDKEN